MRRLVRQGDLARRLPHLGRYTATAALDELSRDLLAEAFSSEAEQARPRALALVQSRSSAGPAPK